MKLNPIALGNGLALATALLFTGCAILAYTATDFVVSLAKSFVHVLDLSSLVKSPMPAFDLGQFLIGLVGLSAYMWLTGWLTGLLYNATSKARSAP